MILESKFDIGDTVYCIYLSQRQIWNACEGCDGSGSIELKNGQDTACPMCFGRTGHYQCDPDNTWQIFNHGTIGLVRVQHVNTPGIEDHVGDNYKAMNSRKEEYMFIETGIGTGSVYNGEKLFRTKKEALAECKKRDEREIQAIDSPAE